MKLSHFDIGMPLFAPEGGEGGGFNFSGASADALGDLQGGGGQPTPGQQPTPPTDGGQQRGAIGQQGGQPTATPTGQVTPQGDQLFDVKINGRIFRVPLSELQAGYSRQADYTQKTMALSERERQWAEYTQKLEAAYQQANQRLSDPRVQAYLQSLQVQARPDEPLTWEQQQQLLRQTAEQQAQHFEQRFGQLADETQIQVLATQYNSDLDNTLTRVLENPQFEVLKDIPGIRVALWQAMVEAQPENINTAKQALVDAAKHASETLTTRFQEQQKRVAAGAAHQLSGIERPGGTPPPPVPQQPGWKLGDKALREAVLADFAATMKP